MISQGFAATDDERAIGVEFSDRWWAWSLQVDFIASPVRRKRLVFVATLGLGGGALRCRSASRKSV